MPTATGHRKLLEQLQADGITYMFGNPGSSEEGLLAEVARFPPSSTCSGFRKRRWCCSPTAMRWRRRSRPSCRSTPASASATRWAVSIMCFASSARRWS